MIKSQIGLEKAVVCIKKIKNSITKFKVNQDKKIKPFQDAIKKVKSKIQPDINALLLEESKYKEEVYQYISENEYGKIPGMSIRSLSKGEIEDKETLLKWLMKKRLFDFCDINEKELIKKIKNESLIVPGWKPHIEDVIVIKGD